MKYSAFISEQSSEHAIALHTLFILYGSDSATELSFVDVLGNIS